MHLLMGSGQWTLESRTHDLDSPFVLSYIALSPVNLHSRHIEVDSENSNGSTVLAIAALDAGVDTTFHQRYSIFQRATDLVHAREGHMAEERLSCWY